MDESATITTTGVWSSAFNRFCRMKLLHLLSVIVVYVCLLQQTKAASVCCPGISPCFTDDPPNQLMPLPQCPEDQDIVMKVYTRDNPTVGQVISRGIIPSVFKGNVLSMFIVHGWLMSENFTWMHTMKDAALAKSDYNVIIVGWSGGSVNLWYPQSASDTRTVGAEIALVSNHTIETRGSSRSRQYCVGHSLGGHVCGFAGKYGQFARITGLDPAGPLYDGRDLSAGLNPSCADLVDVIHTNGGTPTVFGLGTLNRLGHIDFYPNKGSQQPGCVLDPAIPNPNGIFTIHNNTLEIATELTLFCSHIRAYDLFTESILTPCLLSRDVCTLQYNLPVSCQSKDHVVQSLGFDADDYPERGIFYLETNPVSPFCQH